MILLNILNILEEKFEQLLVIYDNATINTSVRNETICLLLKSYFIYSLKDNLKFH